MIFPIILGLAVAREVVSLAEDNKTAHEENDWRHHQHNLEVLVVHVTTCEGVLALHVDKVDEHPSVDREKHESNELREREVGRVHRVAVIPALEKARVGVDIWYIGGP